MKRNNTSAKLDALFHDCYKVWGYFPFFSLKTYDKRMQFREALVITRNMFNEEMVNFEVTKKTAYLEEMTDINVPTLKFQKCPKNTYMYVG